MENNKYKKDNDKKREDSGSGILEEQFDQIKENGSITAANGRHVIHCLTIIGQIEGHDVLPTQNKTTKYELVIPLLIVVEEDPSIKGLLIILNTVGGDVEAGLAIAEMISGMKKPTVSIVLGGGHSIGVPLAVAAKRSFIVPSATMTIHPVRTNGLVVGVPQSFENHKKMQDRITDFVCRNSNIEKKKFTKLMMQTEEIATDVGSIIDGEEAVSLGLIDEVGGLAAALSALHEMIKSET